MSYGIRIAGLSNFERRDHDPWAGRWIERVDLATPGFDPVGVPMDGTVIVTNDPATAMRFDAADEALRFWNQTAPPPYERRPDGKPNRPLTAFTVEVLRLP